MRDGRCILHFFILVVVISLVFIIQLTCSSDGRRREFRDGR
jgi:hypothetical protein